MEAGDLERIAQQAPESAYVVHKQALLANLERLKGARDASGAKLLLALKGFACHATFDWVRPYVDGVSASSPHEAELAFRTIGKSIHSYAPAYSETDISLLARWSDHLIFNSGSQLLRHQPLLSRLNPDIQLGVRLNPEQSEASTELYDPSSPRSRLGIKASDWDQQLTQLISGVHIHNLCENDSFALERTLRALENKFGTLLEKIRWINMGGGHLITREGYDAEHLATIIQQWKSRYGHEVYLEPGAAFGWRTGVLKATVLDIQPAQSGQPANVILNVSATAHMPDVLEMPYRPEIWNAGMPGEKTHTYRLGGLTCLAGDVIGDFSFDEALSVGDPIVFMDMIHYTMVKTSFFNGVRMPSIAIYCSETQTTRVVREFQYEDYANKLS
jgi:carboxynorspermidine decarboxylase